MTTGGGFDPRRDSGLSLSPTFKRAELLFLVPKPLRSMESELGEEEEGYAVQRQEAEICLRAVDSDGDNKIGFEDYLAFAARSKDQWLVSEFSNVLSAVHDIQNKI